MNAETTSAAELGSSKHTILVVDDNAANLRMIAGYLKELGFRILMARSGESGLKRAWHDRPDLILLDILMPGIDGFETCRRLKSDAATKDIPVILMTALTATEHKVTGFQVGAVDYITKPIQEEQVLARVITHLRLRELNERLEQKVRERTDELTIAVTEAKRLNQQLYRVNDELTREITERKRVEEALQKKTHQQEHLIETAHHLTASLDVREVLTRIGVGAKGILSAYSCTIYLLEEDGKTLTPAVAIEPSYEKEVLATSLDAETSFTGQAVRTGRGMIFNDAGSDFSGQQIPDTLVEEEHVIVAPFIADDKALGAMTLSRKEAHLFDEKDLVLAETFAAYAVTALKNAQAHRDLQHEVEERKRAEAEILRLQHLLQNITDSMPSALITLDPDGQVLTWNPTARTLTGRSAAQVQGQSLWQTCPELAHYRELFEQVLDEGKVAHRHREPLSTETGAIYRDVSVFPLVADDLTGAVLRIDDVTRRVRLEEMMLQSAKMASIGRLAAGVAHEINNPLSAMMQSAQVLQLAFDPQRPRTRERLQKCGVDPEGLEHYLQERELMEYLDGIRTIGERAAKIISDLLSFSHRASSDVTSHDMNDLVEQTLALAATDYDLKKQYNFRDIEIVCELAPDLPAIVCDRQQIQQVVLNLVRNAAQAMGKASDELRTPTAAVGPNGDPD